MRIGSRSGFAGACVLLGAWLLAVGRAEAVPVAQAPEPVKTAKADLPPVVVDEFPAPFVPKVPRTRSEEEQLDAQALFAAGRMHEQHQEFAQALRMYQRALRLNPESLPILRQLVPLAFNLDRAEAFRYAMKALQLDPANQDLLRRVVADRIDKGDVTGAISLFRKALDAKVIDPTTPSYVAFQVQLGELYYLQKDYPHAAECYAVVERAIVNPGEFHLNPQMRRLLQDDAGRYLERIGMSYLHTGQTDKALSAFQKAQALAPNTGLHALRLAQVHLKTEQAAEALADLETYFQHEVKGQNDEPYKLLAEVLKALDKEDELLSRLEKLRTRDPGNRPLRLFLAEQYREAKQLDKAEELYLAFVREFPKADEGYEGLGEVYRAQNNAGALLKTLGDSVEKTDETDIVRTLLEQGPAEQTLAKSEALRKAVFAAGDEQLRDHPAQVSYGQRLALALLAVEAKLYPEASRYFELALESNPPRPVRVLQEWGLALLFSKQYTAGVEVLQRAVTKKLVDPEDPTLHYYLAWGLEMIGQTDEALKIAAEAIRTRPQVPLLRLRVGWIQYHAQRYADAEATYRAVLSEFEGTEGAKQARSMLSAIYAQKKDYEKAEEFLQEVLDEYPDDPGANNDLGYLWADQGKHLERALKMTQFAVEREPDNESYLDSLGWALYRLGRNAEALEKLQKAAELAGDEPDAVILDHLGDCLHKANRLPEAIVAWRKALERMRLDNDPDRHRREQLEQKLRLHDQPANPSRLQPAPAAKT